MSIQPIQQEFLHDDKKYVYWTKGKRTHPLLLLIPGFTGTHSNLLPFATHLEESFFIIIPDLPGWGEGEKRGFDFTLSSYARYLHEILFHEKNGTKITILGHCMGATVALEFAYQFPKDVKELFLVSPSYLDKNINHAFFIFLGRVSEKVPKFFRPLFFFWRARIIAIPLGFLVVQSKSLKRKLTIVINNAKAQGHQDEEVVERNWISLMKFQYNKVRNLSITVHIIHGEKDLLIPIKQAQKLQHLLQHGTFDSIPNAGHMPPVETPESLATLVKKYSFPN